MGKTLKRWKTIALVGIIAGSLLTVGVIGIYLQGQGKVIPFPLMLQDTQLQQDYEQLLQMYDQKCQQYNDLLDNYETLLSEYNQLLTEHQELQDDYDSLLVQYNNLQDQIDLLNAQIADLQNQIAVLEAQIDDLNQEIENLQYTNAQLQSEYDQLLAYYTQLQSDYQDLQAEYLLLSAQYQSLYDLWTQPLTSPVIPTPEEVYNWLINIDRTDELEYNEYFMCGDFSIMLINHMKEMNWRGLFVTMEAIIFEYTYDVDWTVLATNTILVPWILAGYYYVPISYSQILSPENGTDMSDLAIHFQVMTGTGVYFSIYNQTEFNVLISDYPYSYLTAVPYITYAYPDNYTSMANIIWKPPDNGTYYMVWFGYDGAGNWVNYSIAQKTVTYDLIPVGGFGHAFVAIECTDGIWFIEPQTDGMWNWYYDTTHNLDCHEVMSMFTDYTECANATMTSIPIYFDNRYPNYSPTMIFIWHINRMA